jgi:phosphatidate cytidylyltransferase
MTLPTRLRPRRAKRRTAEPALIQRIITALVLIPLVLLLILRAPVSALAIIAGIVALLAIREFLELTRHYAVEPFTVATYIYVSVFFAWIAFISNRSPGKFDLRFLDLGSVALLLAVLAPFIFLTIGMRRDGLRSIYPAAGTTVFAFAYIALPMAMLVAVRLQPTGAFMLIFLMAVVWSGDIFAYFVGKSIGRRKMSPRISPKKTWEGAVASLIASVVFGTLLFHYSVPISQFLLSYRLLERGLFPPFGVWAHESETWQIVVLCVALNIAAQLGDLVESAIKRGADVKDSGSILPGHGGMLDRIDAMLFAIPILWIYPFWHGLP